MQDYYVKSLSYMLIIFALLLLTLQVISIRLIASFHQFENNIPHLAFIIAIEF